MEKVETVYGLLNDNELASELRFLIVNKYDSNLDRIEFWNRSDSGIALRSVADYERNNELLRAIYSGLFNEDILDLF